MRPVFILSLLLAFAAAAYRADAAPGTTRALPAAGPTESDARLRIFTPRALIHLEPPTQEMRAWALLDHMGRKIRGGVRKPEEKTLTFENLSPGAYYLFPETEQADPPGRLSGPENRLCFLVLPPASLLPEDHFFAVNQPDMAAPEEKISADDYAWVLAAMHRLGLRRLRTGFEERLVRRSSSSGGNTEIYDWRPFDRLLDDASQKKIRFIACLGLENPSEPPAPAPSRFLHLAPATPSDAFLLPETTRGDAGTSGENYIRALSQRFGFKLDEFVLGPGPGRSGGPVHLPAFIEQAAPAYRLIKTRSPYSTVAPGLLETLDPSRTPDDALRKLLRAGTSCGDMLDHPADGPLETVRAQVAKLDALARETSVSEKSRAVSSAAMSAADDSIAAQWRQSAETVKKLVFFRHRGYRYFAAARMLDDAPGGTGFFRRAASGAAPQPRMVAAAWTQALARLGGTKPVRRLGFAADTHELYGFEKPDETVLMAWAPIRPDDRRFDKTIKVVLYWPEHAPAEAFDLLGHPVSALRILETKTNAGKTEKSGVVPREVVLTEEPVYLVIAAPAERVGW